MKTTNLAFVSTAHIHTKGFIENVLKAEDGRRVAVVWDDVPERGRRYAEMAGAPFEASLDAVVADAAVDGFVVCAENTRHLDLLKRVLRAGKPVMCEKPLLADPRGLEEVLALADESGAVLMSGYFMPFSAGVQGVVDFLGTEAAGKPRRIRMINAHHAAYGRWFDSADLAWFTQPALSGGGAFMDMGTHALHLVRSLFGTGRVVAADIRNLSGQYPEVDDAGVAVLALDCGAQAVVEAMWIRQAGANGLEIQTTTGAILESCGGYVFQAPGRESVQIPAGRERPTRIDRLVAAIRGELGAEELRADREAVADVVRWMADAYACAS
jgi:predicted dehydrogenase